MKSRLLFAIFIPYLAFSQQLGGWDKDDATTRERLLYNLRYAQVQSDTFEFNYAKSPGVAFLLSAAIPGAGEFYAGARYRAIAFASVEAISWAVYFNQKSTGNKIEKSYKHFANNHWSLWNWYANSLTYPDLFGLTRKGFGSHSIWIEYNGMEYPAHEDTLNLYIPTWASILANEKDLPFEQQTLRPIRTRDFYENIGKYDQFATGWDDFSTDYVDTTQIEPVKNSPERNKYLNDRYKSNQALKMATNFATVIMFNHLISAFHAQIAAKHYRPPESKSVSWSLDLVADYRYRYPIRGINVSLSF